MSNFKEDKTKKIIDDTTTVVNDFIRQKPFGLYRPIEYFISSEFEGLKDQIDKYLEALFKGEVDEANGDILDNLIFDSTRQEFHNLRKQKEDHREVIRNHEIQSEGAKTAFIEHKRLISEKLSECTTKLAAIDKRYQEDKFEKKI